MRNCRYFICLLSRKFPNHKFAISIYILIGAIRINNKYSAIAKNMTS